MDNCPCSGNPYVDLFTHRGSCVIFHLLSLSVFLSLSRAYLCSSPVWFFSSTPVIHHCPAPSSSAPPCSLVTSALSPYLCLFPPAPHCFSLYLSPVISPAGLLCLPDQLTCSRGLLHLGPPSLLSVWHGTQKETGQWPFIINFKQLVVLGAILTVYMSYWTSSMVYGDVVRCCTVKFASLLSHTGSNYHSNVASCCVWVSWIDSTSL